MIKASAAAAVVGTVLCASAALANPVSINVGDHLRFSAGPGANNGEPLGGELIVNIFQTGQIFRTFCLEQEETIFFGGPGGTFPFEVVGISTGAVFGGGNPDNPGGGFDPISSRTAFLYERFATGTLDGYNFGLNTDPDRIRSADALQNAIWYLEHEISDPYANIADPATQALIDHFLTMDMGDYTGIGNIRVLNLVYRIQGPNGEQVGEVAQDVLVMVPLPHAAGLGLAGLLGVVGLTGRRRR